MSFQSELLLARVRPPIAGLVLPYLALFASAVLVGFYAGRLPEQWQNILVWTIAATIAIFFWLVPLIGYLTHLSNITTSRISSRSGLFGQRHREVSLSKVSGAQAGPKHTVVLTVSGEEPFVLSRVPRPKSVASQINQLLATK
ncbi:MAG: hypothetical protein RLZZ359_997 [Actinomycetota bacterium]|jgi:Ni/Fe-hydrogenase subunit HybB-like protein